MSGTSEYVSERCCWLSSRQGDRFDEHIAAANLAWSNVSATIQSHPSLAKVAAEYVARLLLLLTVMQNETNVQGLLPALDAQESSDNKTAKQSHVVSTRRAKHYILVNSLWTSRIEALVHGLHVQGDKRAIWPAVCHAWICPFQWQPQAGEPVLLCHVASEQERLRCCPLSSAETGTAAQHARGHLGGGRFLKSCRMSTWRWFSLVCKGNNEAFVKYQAARSSAMDSKRFHVWATERKKPWRVDEHL